MFKDFSLKKKQNKYIPIIYVNNTTLKYIPKAS